MHRSNISIRMLAVGAAGCVLGYLLFAPTSEISPPQLSTLDVPLTRDQELRHEAELAHCLDGVWPSGGAISEGGGVERFDVTPLVEGGLSGSDSSWGDIPKTSFYLPRELVGNIGCIETRGLFRNSGLNKMDVYIPLTTRVRLAGLFESKRAALAKLEDEVKRVASDELVSIIDAGLAPTKTYGEYLEGLSEEARFLITQKQKEATDNLRIELEGDNVPADVVQNSLANLQVIIASDVFGFSPYASRRVGDRYYGATLKHLPRARAAISVYKVALVELLSKICSEFVGVQALEPGRSEDMLKNLEKLLATTYPE